MILKKSQSQHSWRSFPLHIYGIMCPKSICQKDLQRLQELVLRSLNCTHFKTQDSNLLRAKGSMPRPSYEPLHGNERSCRPETNFRDMYVSSNSSQGQQKKHLIPHLHCFWSVTRLWYSLLLIPSWQPHSLKSCWKRLCEAKPKSNMLFQLAWVHIVVDILPARKGLHTKI